MEKDFKLISNISKDIIKSLKVDYITQKTEDLEKLLDKILEKHEENLDNALGNLIFSRRESYEEEILLNKILENKYKELLNK